MADFIGGPLHGKNIPVNDSGAVHHRILFPARTNPDICSERWDDPMPLIGMSNHVYERGRDGRYYFQQPKSPITPCDAFLAAIIENPADDTPRLVFADWLEEHGESERAEFIRVQCRLAKTPKPAEYTIGALFQPPNTVEAEEARCVECRRHDSRCHYHVLCRRERELLDIRGREWLSILAPGCCSISPTPDEVRRFFRRGFIAEITLSCADWLARREQLLLTAPLEEVTLTGMGLQNVDQVIMRRGDRALLAPTSDGGQIDLSF